MYYDKTTGGYVSCLCKCILTFKLSHGMQAYIVRLEEEISDPLNVAWVTFLFLPGASYIVFMSAHAKIWAQCPGPDHSRP